jgi:hypothetical protein
MNANNATSNNMQSEALAGMANSYNEVNCVCCFNHTLQLSAKTLLHLFNIALGKAVEDDKGLKDADAIFDEDDKSDNDETKEGDGLPNIPDEDNIDDGIDELEELDEETCEQLIVDIEAIHQTISKVFVPSNNPICLLMLFHSFVHWLHQQILGQLHRSIILYSSTM